MRTASKVAAATVVLLGILVGASYVIQQAKPTERVEIQRVIDGDTVVKEDGTRIRLIGLDAPEVSTGECFNEQATAALWDILDNKTVTAEVDPSQDTTDRYQRELRYLTAGDVDVQLALIEGGFAREATYAGAYERQQLYRQAQQRAQAQGQGMWRQGACDE